MQRPTDDSLPPHDLFPKASRGHDMEVPELIKNASETTAATLSHLVDDVKDRLDSNVLHRHAPPPKKHFPVRAAVLVLAGAVVVMLAVGRRCAAKWRGERFTEPKADRPPTPDEARAADRFASRV